MKTKTSVVVEISTYGAYCDGRYDSKCPFLDGKVKWDVWYCNLFNEVLQLQKDTISHLIRCHQCEKLVEG